jgi:hypothetical protein
MYYLGSMTPMRHHIRMSVFKCMLTVSCVALFAVQFSYNCQRIPDAVGSAVGAGADDGDVTGVDVTGADVAGAGTDGAVAGGARPAGTVAVYHNVSLDFNGKPKVHLCLDKRYALQPIFLLAGSRHRLATVFPAGVHFCPIDSHPALSMASRLHSLRGPPQQVV